MSLQRSWLGDMRQMFRGGFGVGLVLIVLPSAALVLGAVYLDRAPAVVLPILAIFGIMMLFGALSLVSTLFARLKLADPNEALALPRGSVRATMALALVVLFAIISIMLYQSISEPYVIKGLTNASKEEFVKDVRNRILAIVPECSGPDQKPMTCPADDPRYSVHMVQPPGQESTDLAKQLLILIGTLMTSVTSFYFASRSSEVKGRQDAAAYEQANAATATLLASATAGPKAASTSLTEDEFEGGHLPITDATPDDALPPSQGGVQS
jgi:hypothetical protein